MLRTCVCCIVFFWSNFSNAQSLDQVYGHLRSGSLDSAEIALNQLPSSAKQLALKAYINSKRGYKQKAILFYHEALNQNPSPKLKYDCHWNLALLYQQMGLYTSAMEQYSKLDKILGGSVQDSMTNDRKHEFYLYNLNKGILLSLSNSGTAALRQFEETLKYAVFAEQEHRVLNLIGIEFKDTGNLEDAIGAYNRIINSDHLSKYTGRAYHNRAMALKELGKDPLPDLYKALEYKTGEARFVTLMDLGELTQDMTLLDSALTHYPKEADPDDYKIYRIMMHLALDQGAIAQARAYDSLFQSANTAYLDMMRESKELAQRYATINTLAQYEQQQEQSRREAANRKRDFLIMVVLGALALVALGFYGVTRKRKLAMVREVTDILQGPKS